MALVNFQKDLLICRQGLQNSTLWYGKLIPCSNGGSNQSIYAGDKWLQSAKKASNNLNFWKKENQHTRVPDFLYGYVEPTTVHAPLVNTNPFCGSSFDSFWERLSRWKTNICAVFMTLWCRVDNFNARFMEDRWCKREPVRNGREESRSNKPREGFVRIDFLAELCKQGPCVSIVRNAS